MSQDLLPGLVSRLTPAGLASTVTPAGLSCAVTPAGPTSKLTPAVHCGAGEPDPDTIKMFVGQVPRTMSEQDLVNLFQVRVHYIPGSFREKPELLKALTRTPIQALKGKITLGSFQFFLENSRKYSQLKVHHRGSKFCWCC
jgi:hypothetical protein